MTEYFAAYLATMVIRDANLAQTAMLAIAAVFSWFAVEFFPWPKLRAILHRSYLVGGLALYLVTFYISVRSFV